MDITSSEKTPLLESQWLRRVFEGYGLQPVFAGYGLKSLRDYPRSPFSLGKGRQSSSEGTAEQIRGIEFVSMVLTHTLQSVRNSLKTGPALAEGSDPDVYPGPGPDPGPDPNPVPLPPPDPDPGLPLDPLPTPAPVY